MDEFLLVRDECYLMTEEYWLTRLLCEYWKIERVIR